MLYFNALYVTMVIMIYYPRSIPLFNLGILRTSILGMRNNSFAHKSHLSLYFVINFIQVGVGNVSGQL